jgi:hypothetical protein
VLGRLAYGSLTAGAGLIGNALFSMTSAAIHQRWRKFSLVLLSASVLLFLAAGLRQVCVMKHRLFLVGTALCASSGIPLMQADENPLTIPEPITGSANKSVQRQNISPWVLELFAAKKLDAQYEFAFALNPSCLQGHFNGDGNIDVAVLVKQRATQKLGVAIVHGGMGKVTILGAGTAIGNGGDDFEWMDSWQVYAKSRAAHAASETSILHLRGDAPGE